MPPGFQHFAGIRIKTRETPIEASGADLEAPPDVTWCLVAGQLVVASNSLVGEGLGSENQIDESRAGMLDRCFFQRDPVTCAQELVGCKLTCGRLSGIVVETEAYDAVGDDACHTASRPSARAFVSGHESGTAYVYFSYGVHWMLNVLVKAERAGFVLIRALEPLEGIEEMKKARGVQNPRQLCSGPGKLTKALSITGRYHGKDMCSDGDFAFSRGRDNGLVNSSLRIGISRAIDFPWRFYAAGNPHVSRTSPRQGRAGVEPARL